MITFSFTLPLPLNYHYSCFPSTIDNNPTEKRELTISDIIIIAICVNVIAIIIIIICVIVIVFYILIIVKSSCKFYKRPKKSVSRAFFLQVWLWILAMMGLMGPLIYLIILLRVRLCRGDPTLTRTFPLDQCIWFVFGAMMKQGSVLSPISGRPVFTVGKAKGYFVKKRVKLV